MLGENRQTIRENAEILLEASKGIGLEVNPEKTKYMIMSCDQNIARNGTIKIGDLSFEEVEKFKYLGATVTNINDSREEIKIRINMGNACYYSVEKLLSSSLLSKNLKVRIYKTVILPVVLYGCETWTLTLREEHKLRVFENKVLRKIFGAKRDEVTGEWRKLHNTELHALYSSSDIIRNIKSRRLRWTGHVVRMGESRNAYRVLVGRPEGKRPLGRPRRRWEDNIKIDLREVGHGDREWINLAQDRDQWRAYVRASMSLRFLRANEACNYYAHHLKSVKKVVQSFDLDDAAAIQIRQELLNDRKIEKEAMDIKTNFGYLPDAIIQLERSGVEIVEQIIMMRTIVNKLSAVEGEIGKRVVSFISMSGSTYLDSTPCLLAERPSLTLVAWPGARSDAKARRIPETPRAGYPSAAKNLKVRIYKTVILPVLVYGCETWTLTLREEHRLRVFENKMLRRIFRAKRDEVTGEWRKLHNTELHALYSSPDIIIRNIKSRRLRWAGHVALMGGSRNAYRVLVGRPEEKPPLGRPRRRWEDNIKMDFREVGYDDREWINLGQDRDVWRAYVRAAMNLQFP
ncbi:hypothetical protein ANN_12172 [Periplaneta americana]|uniref:Reverse transcriptase domain-containing protein n=1 Tax=Periplaneta americana TaxID=6978 RepID=A0ABQ8T726_PERAM|nr:hypothetical protein ANN_12172 [Periplaneta americana]